MNVGSGMTGLPPAVLCPAGVAHPSSQAVGSALDRIAYAGLWVYVLALSWENGVPVQGAYEIGRLIGLAVLGIALLRAAVMGRERKLCDLHYWMLAFVAWSAASIFWTLDWASTATRVGTYAQLLVFAWLIWTLATSDARVLGLLKAYLFGMSICALETVRNLMTGRTYGQLDDMDATRSDRYTAGGLNPNDLGLMLALAIPIILYLLARRKGNPVMALAYWLQFVLCLTAIFLSGSRGSLLAAAPALLMLPLTFVRLPRWQKVLATAAFAGAIACAVSFVPTETWLRFFHLGTDLTAGTMTHRTQIWTASLEVFRNHALLGVGAAAHPVAVADLLARPYVAHNTFLSVLVELGVPGGLVLLGLLVTAFYLAFRMGGLERNLWVLTLLAWCIGVSGLTWEFHKATWFLLGLLAAHAYARRETDLHLARSSP